MIYEHSVFYHLVIFLSTKLCSFQGGGLTHFYTFNLFYVLILQMAF